MATTTYEETTLTLIDGTKVTVRPLKSLYFVRL